MNAIKLKSIQNSMVSAKNNSARSVSIFKAYSRFHTLNKDSFSAFANIESFSVTGSSLKRQNMRILIEDFVDAVGSHGCYRRFTDHMKRCEI